MSSVKYAITYHSCTCQRELDMRVRFYHSSMSSVLVFVTRSKERYVVSGMSSRTLASVAQSIAIKRQCFYTFKLHLRNT